MGLIYNKPNEGTLDDNDKILGTSGEDNSTVNFPLLKIYEYLVNTKGVMTALSAVDITGLTATTADTGDYIPLVDATDGSLKKALVDDLIGGGFDITFFDSLPSVTFTNGDRIVIKDVTDNQLKQAILNLAPQITDISGLSTSTAVPGDFVMFWDVSLNELRKSDVVDFIDLSSDTTPQLGGDLDPNGFGVSGHLLPSTDNTYDLGSVLVGWKDLYAEDVNVDLILSVASAGHVNLQGASYIKMGPTSTVPAGPLHGYLYADVSALRMKYHDGTSFKNVLLEGDVDTLETANLTIPSSTSRFVDIPITSDVTFRQGGLTNLLTIDGNGDITVAAAANFTVPESFISARTLVTAASGDHILVRDATDGALKKVDAADFLGGGGGSGDVVGPASAVDNTVVRFDSTTGKLIQGSALVINDNGEISGGSNSGTATTVLDMSGDATFPAVEFTWASGSRLKIQEEANALWGGGNGLVLQVNNSGSTSIPGVIESYNTNNFYISSGGTGTDDIIIAPNRSSVATFTPSSITFTQDFTLQKEDATLTIYDNNSGTDRYAALVLQTAGGTWYVKNGEDGAAFDNDFIISRVAAGTDDRLKLSRDSYTLELYNSSNAVGLTLNANTGVADLPGGFTLGSGTTTCTFAGNDLQFERTDGPSYISQVGNNALIFQTRNAANSANVPRINIGSSADAGAATITSYENIYINRGNGSNQSASISRNMIDYDIITNAANTTSNYKGIIGVGETTSTVAAGISSFDDGTGAALGISLFTGNNTTVTEALRIDSSQNVSVPNGNLTVGGINTLKTVIPIAVTNEVTPIAVGTSQMTFRMPFAMTLTEVRASLTTAGGTSGTTTVDINEGGVSILSTKLTIDQGEKTSTTAATAAVISDSALADDAEITVDVDAITGAGTEAGLKIYLIGTINS